MKLERIYFLVSEKTAVGKGANLANEVCDPQGIIFFRDRGCLLASIPFRESFAAAQPPFVPVVSEDRKGREGCRHKNYSTVRSKEERDKLIETNLPLVLSLASRFRNSRLPLDDRLQEGSMGLIRAVDKLDLAQLGTFYAFAGTLIVNAIKDANNEERTVRKPPPLAKILNKIPGVTEQLTQALNRLPTVDEIIEELQCGGYQGKTVKKALVTEGVISLDAGHPQVDGEKNGQFELYGSIPDPAGTTEDQVLSREEVLDAEKRDLCLHREVKRLDFRLQLIVRLYYTEKRTEKEIGILMGISESRVSQLHSKALQSLRASATLRSHIEDNLTSLLPPKRRVNYSRASKLPRWH